DRHYHQQLERECITVLRIAFRIAMADRIDIGKDVDKIFIDQPYADFQSYDGCCSDYENSSQDDPPAFTGDRHHEGGGGDIACQHRKSENAIYVSPLIAAEF